jgi:UDP-N-acetylmuramoylalanine-D-glutamate ligase
MTPKLPTSTRPILRLESMDAPTVWIVGGVDKGQ